MTLSSSCVIHLSASLDRRSGNLVVKVCSLVTLIEFYAAFSKILLQGMPEMAFTSCTHAGK